MVKRLWRKVVHNIIYLDNEEKYQPNVFLSGTGYYIKSQKVVPLRPHYV